MRESATDKLRVGWRIRAMRYERRLKKRREDSLLRYCWKKKRINGRMYSEERKRFYNRNGWGINVRELGDDGNEGRLEEEIIRKEREGQRQGR